MDYNQMRTNRIQGDDINHRRRVIIFLSKKGKEVE